MSWWLPNTNGTSASLVAKIIVWCLVYYATSALSGVYNKWLVDGKTFSVSPTFLTWFHLVVALGTDYAVMSRSPEETQARKQLEREKPRSGLDIVTAFTPIAVFVILSKLTTYLSYQHVSIALSHTAKASEPIFNVIVAAIVFGEYHTPAVYASLLPISIGILLASVTELTYDSPGHHSGYGFAVGAASALMKVLQNIYTKKLMLQGRWTFWEVHLYCGAASLVIMLPLMYVSWVSLHNPAWEGGLPIFGLLFDAFLQWASSVSAYVVLSLVTHLTATIINTFKRVVLITSGAMTDPSARLTPLNALGVVLACAGIFLYNVVKDSEYLQAQIHSGMGRATQIMGLHVPLPAWLDAWAEKQTGNGGGATAPAAASAEPAGPVSLVRLAWWLRRSFTRLLVTYLPADSPWLGKLAGYRLVSGREGRSRGPSSASGSTAGEAPNHNDVESADGGIAGGIGPASTGVGGFGGMLLGKELTSPPSLPGSNTTGLANGYISAGAASSGLSPTLLPAGVEAGLLSGAGWSSATAAVSTALRSAAAGLPAGGRDGSNSLSTRGALAGQSSPLHHGASGRGWVTPLDTPVAEGQLGGDGGQAVAGNATAAVTAARGAGTAGTPQVHAGAAGLVTRAIDRSASAAGSSADDGGGGVGADVTDGGRAASGASASAGSLTPAYLPVGSPTPGPGPAAAGGPQVVGGEGAEAASQAGKMRTLMTRTYLGPGLGLDSPLPFTPVPAARPPPGAALVPEAAIGGGGEGQGAGGARRHFDFRTE